MMLLIRTGRVIGQPALGARLARILACRRQQGELADQLLAPLPIQCVGERRRGIGFQAKLAGARREGLQYLRVYAPAWRQVAPTLM